MDLRLSSGSNDSSNTSTRSQNMSSTTNGSSMGTVKYQYNSLGNTNNKNSGVTSPNTSYGFTPFQNNWAKGNNFTNSGTVLSPSSTVYSSYQTQQAPNLTRHQSLSNYKNLESLNMNFQDLSMTLHDSSYSAIIDSSPIRTQSKNVSEEGIDRLRFENKTKDELINKLKIELDKKDITIRSLRVQAEKTNEIPMSHFKLYHKLSSNLLILQNKYNESELFLESILTAIALNPQQSVIENGRYDAEELAHKMITKIKLLQEENNEMLKMLSYGRSKQKDIELLVLRTKISELEKKLGGSLKN